MATETPKITIHDIASGEIIVRPMSDEEIAQTQETFPDAFTEETQPE